MRFYLERLLTRACKLVTDAFPVEEDLHERHGNEYVRCTKKRANFDSHKDEWLTYLTIPNLNQDDPYDRDETAEPAPVPTIIPGITTADVSTELLQMLIEHFSDDADDDSTSEESATEDDSTSDIAEEITTGDDVAGDATAYTCTTAEKSTWVQDGTW
jgi:hypothetical protein